MVIVAIVALADGWLDELYVVPVSGRADYEKRGEVNSFFQSVFYLTFSLFLLCEDWL